MALHRIWTDIKWIGGMTWMAAKQDMELIEEAQWEQDEFLDFWIPRKKDELDFIGIVVSIRLHLPTFFRQLTISTGGFARRRGHHLSWSARDGRHALAHPRFVVLHADIQHRVGRARVPAERRTQRRRARQSDPRAQLPPGHKQAQRTRRIRPRAHEPAVVRAARVLRHCGMAGARAAADIRAGVLLFRAAGIPRAAAGGGTVGPQTEGKFFFSGELEHS